jgi:hypothetical protein
MTVRFKSVSTSIDLLLKTGTALLTTFAAALVLIGVQVHFDRSLTTQQQHVALTSNDRH